ncbi:predicted protein [Plenodomus lingam JN3]|uniref:Predicted protein n=1 Tax=Leptosphaeria maculans (strain JN3 / isolate v23.1.3 / race Av1-4-5-6-7-8) TaxID=985895 RepID=E5ACU7_LEPMJ|nr:predicted protein [Plenodomus lingam JN3]CBY02299.1 predicted protein [Plenodomus lingam JN3]
MMLNTTILAVHLLLASTLAAPPHDALNLDAAALTPPAVSTLTTTVVSIGDGTAEPDVLENEEGVTTVTTTITSTATFPAPPPAPSSPPSTISRHLPVLTSFYSAIPDPPTPLTLQPSANGTMARSFNWPTSYSITPTTTYNNGSLPPATISLAASSLFTVSAFRATSMPPLESTSAPLVNASLPATALESTTPTSARRVADVEAVAWAGMDGALQWEERRRLERGERRG